MEDDGEGGGGDGVEGDGDNLVYLFGRSYLV